ERLAAIAERRVDVELEDLEIGRSRRPILPDDRRRRRPADRAILDFGDDHVIGVFTIVDADQRAALEALDAVHARLARADLEIEREQRARGGGLLEADPDVVAPAPLVERANAERRLVPGVLDQELGARGVIRARR